MKHLEVRQKYSAARRIFNATLLTSQCFISGDETLRLMLYILLESQICQFLLCQQSVASKRPI